MRKALLLAALMASAACAQQVTTTGKSAVITHLLDGDGWQTWITLSNIDATPSQYIVYFFKEDGTPLSLLTDQAVPGDNTFVNGSIPAHGAVTIKTFGTNPNLTQGWAKMQTIFNIPGGGVAPGATIAGTALFLRPQTVDRPTEASEPLDYSTLPRWALPFDHTNGYTTGLALVNQSNVAGTVSITFYDESGAVLLAVPPFNLASGHHQAIVLTTIPTYANVIGRKGTVVIQTTAPSINVIGARTTPLGEVSGTSPISW